MVKERNARSKYLIAVFLLVAALMAIASALISVYAASVQGTSSDFHIQYDVGRNIAVSVGAEYQIKNQDVVSVGSVKFDANSSNRSDYLGTGTRLELTDKQNYVDFTYTFQNLSNKDYAKVTSSWTRFETDLSNINCSYLITAEQVGQETTLTSVDDFSQMALVLNPSATYSIRIRFAVADSIFDAYVSSSGEYGLRFVIEYLHS